jgi:HTH-type transcriptional regulator/antitoxin HigA
VERLWGAPRGTAAGDELDVLATLIEAYEREHYPIDLPGPIEAIKFRLEQTGESVRKLVGIIGQRSRVYEVLRGDRGLSLKMIRRLHQELGIPAQVLIEPSRRRQSRSRSHRGSLAERSRPARLQKSA